MDEDGNIVRRKKMSNSSKKNPLKKIKSRFRNHLDKICENPESKIQSSKNVLEAAFNYGESIYYFNWAIRKSE